MPYREVRREVIRFLLSGGVNTALTYGAYLVLNLYVVYWIAYTIAYVFGILLSYVLNARLVFQVSMSWFTFLAYPLVYIAQYVVGVLVLRYLVEALSLPESWSPLIVIVLTLPVTFGLSRLILRANSQLGAGSDPTG